MCMCPSESKRGLDKLMERTSVPISAIVIWHKHEATELLCAQNPTLLTRAARALVERHKCVEVNVID